MHLQNTNVFVKCLEVCARISQITESPAPSAGRSVELRWLYSKCCTSCLHSLALIPYLASKKPRTFVPLKPHATDSTIISHCRDFHVLRANARQILWCTPRRIKCTLEMLQICSDPSETCNANQLAGSIQLLFP